MRKKPIYRVKPQTTIKHTRFDPNSITPEQREANLAKIQFPVTVCFTEEPHPEVFQKVRSILLSACSPEAIITD